MSNLINSDKEKIVSLVKTWRKCSGLTVNQVVARMQASGCDISRTQFENHFTTRLEQAPNAPPEWVVALVQAFSDGLLEHERCRVEEAIELAVLTGLPLGQLGRLRQFFPIQAFEQASKQYLLALGSRTETATPSHPYLQRVDWGEAPDVTLFYGRQAELAALKQWLVVDRCRLVSVLGLGGVGKTALVTKLAEQLTGQFDYIIWRSLRSAPPLGDILGEWFRFLSHQRESELAERIDQRLAWLMDYLREQRCLLILDNAEAILLEGERAGSYRPGYEAYGELLRRAGEARHQSCLILTSREKPQEMATLEGVSSPARSLRLSGLAATEGREIFRTKGLFSGTDDEWRDLIEHRHAGNPLALQMVATTILELYAGNLSNFLKQDEIVSGDVGRLIEEQFNRLSALEQDVMVWLAIEQEPVLISTLAENIVSPASQSRLLETLESLSRRSLVEKISAGFDIRFTLQNVIREYVTGRLIEQVCTEIRTEALALFQSHTLIKAQAKGYLRESQTRLILAPVADRLRAIAGPTVVEERLKRILARLRDSQPRAGGYAGGNALNLLVQLNSDLSGYDFSQLAIWQAHLQGVALQDVNFTQADLARSVFTETFGDILSVAFSSDGRLLAAGTTKGEVYLWQASEGQPFFICLGHTDWVSSVAFSPDGRLLASGSSDRTVRLWDVSTGSCLKTLQGHTDWVLSVAFNPDGHILISGSADQSIGLWEVRSGQHLGSLQGHTGRVNSVVFHPKGDTIASAGEDQTVRVWDVETKQCRVMLLGHTAEVLSVAYNPDGRTLASASGDQTLRLWATEAHTSHCLKILSGHTGRVRAVAFSPDGRTLASGSEDQTVRVWDADPNSGQCRYILRGYSDWVLAVAFSPAGRTLASGRYNQTVHLWDVETGQLLRTLQGHTHWILSITFSPDGRTLVSGSNDQFIRMWNVSPNGGQCLKTLSGHTHWVWSVAFSPDGRLFASGSNDREVRLWEAVTGRCLKTLSGHSHWIASVAFSPDGHILASGSGDQTIRLWAVETGQELQPLRGHTAPVRSVAFSPNNSGLLASGSEDRTVRLWELAENVWQSSKTWSGHTGWILAVAFSPDGRLLASGSSDQTIRLWDISTVLNAGVSTGQCLKILTGHTGWVRSVAFSSDGRSLVSGSEDRTVRVWGLDASAGQNCQILAGHTAGVKSVAFDPTGEMIAGAGDDSTIRFWHAQTGASLITLRPDRPYERMNITGATGLTEAQKAALKALGAIETVE